MLNKNNLCFRRVLTPFQSDFENAMETQLTGISFSIFRTIVTFPYKRLYLYCYVMDKASIQLGLPVQEAESLDPTVQRDLSFNIFFKTIQ